MILALDISSTNIGMVVLDSSSTTVLYKATARLDREDAPLPKRIVRASEWMERILMQLQGDGVRLRLVAIESPAHTARPLAMIAQQRVVGAVMVILTKAGLRVVEISPTTAKAALAGSGRADKHLMIHCAHMIMGECTEHEADALGVALGSGRPVSKPTRKKKTV